MFKRTKKLTSVLLSLLMLLSSFPLISFAADEYDVGNGVVVASETCTNSNCDFSYTIYENGLLVVDGNRSHTHIIPTNNVEKVYIGDNAQNIGGALFRYLSTVKEYTVSSDNENYTSVDGVLYSKDMTQIVAYPQGRTDETFNISATVKEIGSYAFMCSKLTSIFIPKTIKLILPYAFNGSSLESVTFEDGERNLIISFYSFGECENLNSILLHGSRVYAVSAFSFIDTAFYDNESKWENGVLYLNDIILATNPRELSAEYIIKNGTTTIADFAQFEYPVTGEQYDFVYVTIPESVDNIGEISVYKFNKLPDNLIRFGSFYYYIESNNESKKEAYSEYLEKLENIKSKYGIDNDTDSSSFPTAAKIEIFNQCGVIYITKYNWIQAANIGFILSQYNNGAEFLSEDTVGIADVTDIYTLGDSYPAIDFFYLFPVFYDGLILPESFETLSNCTIISEHILSSLALSTEKSVTFLNPDCKIFDDENTLWVGYTICGYKGSTAEAYAKKYNRKFVAIDDCKHETTCRNAVLEATCGYEGYTGDLYCQYCGELLENGKLTDKTENHNFGEPKQLTYATCTEWGTAEYTCKDCGTTKVMDYEEPTGHTYIYNYSFDADCIYDGYVASYCYCGAYKKTITEPALGHIDENHDLHCDRCGEKFRDCDCMCHKSGFSGFIYKLIKIFWKLFRTNQTCECGASHY